MRITGSNVYLIKIHGWVNYMNPERYIQYATKGPEGRFYINREAAGGVSISEKRVTILAQKILYWD